MAFELPPEANDSAQALRELEATASRPEVKALLIQAATELESWRKYALSWAEQLEEAAKLRIGQMDSQSRADEVSRQVKSTMLNCAALMRASL